MLAAAHETGLIAALEQALPTGAQVAPRLARSTPATRRQSLLTLLFLGVVGLRRTCDLRGYPGEALARLSGRRRASGFWHTERFLSQVAQAGGDETLTDALAAWTARLWREEPQEPGQPPPAFYLDGHKKPVYTDHLIPRGLIGRTGKILGCRALLLLHDAAGHPLFATTDRGDLALTKGVPAFLTRYEQAADPARIVRLIVDREGLAAEFLAELVAQERTVVTVLRADQYDGLASFTEVGAFVPLCRDRQGTVTREVAPARFALPLPDHPGQILPRCVALIRDLRRQVPCAASADEEEEGPPRWDADLQGEQRRWWAPGWVATPQPAIQTTPKLIPIVTTACEADPLELVSAYTRRWPTQENVIRDWRLPLGLDTNHGSAQRRVEHSEVARRRETLQKRQATLQHRAEGARQRAERASRLYQHRWTALRPQSRALYEELSQYEQGLERQSIAREQLYQLKKAAQARVQEKLGKLQERLAHASYTSQQEHKKSERYAQEHRAVLRALEDLAANERAMYELDHAKDQVMTALKLALANVAMWTRDTYFPASYAQATWHRLVPFFRLPGRVEWGRDTVQVTLRPFNDRCLTRDLAGLCQRVEAARPRLPDGRWLVVRLACASCPTLPAQQCLVA